eukprot:scaffold79653_cov49-Attheya_sp.AAC.4
MTRLQNRRQGNRRSERLSMTWYDPNRTQEYHTLLTTAFLAFDRRAIVSAGQVQDDAIDKHSVRGPRCHRDAWFSNGSSSLRCSSETHSTIASAPKEHACFHFLPLALSLVERERSLGDLNGIRTWFPTTVSPKISPKIMFKDTDGDEPVSKLYLEDTYSYSDSLVNPSLSSMPTKQGEIIPASTITVALHRYKIAYRTA